DRPLAIHYVALRAPAHDADSRTRPGHVPVGPVSGSRLADDPVLVRRDRGSRSPSGPRSDDQLVCAAQGYREGVARRERRGRFRGSADRRIPGRHPGGLVQPADPYRSLCTAHRIHCALGTLRPRDRRGRPGARTPHGPDRAIPAYRVRPGRRTDPESRGRHAPHEPLPAIPTGTPGDGGRRTTDDTRAVRRARAPCSASAGASRVWAPRGGRRIVAVETPRPPGDGTLPPRNGREETNDAARCADCRRSTDPARGPTHG